MEVSVQLVKLAQKGLCGLTGKRNCQPLPPEGFRWIVLRVTAQGSGLLLAKSLHFSCWPKKKVTMLKRNPNNTFNSVGEAVAIS